LFTKNTDWMRTEKNSSEILTAALSLATELYDQGDNFVDPIGRAGHSLGLDWLLVYESNQRETVAVKYWNTVRQESTDVPCSDGETVREWASKNRVFCGLRSSLPFQTMFVPEDHDGCVLFIPDYRSDQSWGVTGFGKAVAPEGDEKAALTGFGKLLLSVIRRQEKEQGIRKQIESYLPRMRQTLIPVTVTL